ncbi:MAG: oligosaccharide flippase family protein, partial [Prevotella sp.]|nr:oligosaccharide flippase family protein [Prevotella sp.]
MWGTLTSAATQMLNVVFGIIFGRLLSPADIGLVGMITIFTVLANNLQESGFFTTLANQKNPTHRDFNSVFWFCISLSLI